MEARATPEQKKKLSKLDRAQVRITELAGDPIEPCSRTRRATRRPSAASRSPRKNGWFAARPSGTEDIYKIYAESFRDEQHLRTLLQEAQRIVDAALA